jgi:DNA-binding transcriptional LysR family regulator
VGKGSPVVASATTGFVRNAFWSGLLPRALSSFRTRHPRVEIELHNCTSRVQLQMLLRREIDVGLAHWPAANRQVQSECVLRHSFRLAAPGEHPLLGRTEVRPADLAAVPWIVVERKHDPTAHDRLLAACARAGFRPNIEYETSDLPLLLSFAADRRSCPNAPLRHYSPAAIAAGVN